MITNTDNINIEIDNLLDYTSKLLDNNKLKKSLLMKMLINIYKKVKCSENINNYNELFSQINDIKENLELVCYNLNKLNEAQALLLSTKDIDKSEEVQANIKQYHKIWNKNVNVIFSNYITIENFLSHSNIDVSSAQSNVITENADLPTSNNITKNNYDTLKNNTINSNIAHQEVDTMPNDMDIQTSQEIPIQDNNTLLISEIQGKVFLPYKLIDLENLFLKYQDKYTNIKEIINDKYVVPISRFKFPIIARFKEAYSLMKNKEKASIMESLSLGIELAKNSLLNPAVITACKNVDELDIYLDYLSNDKLEQFDIFKVEYEILPTKI